MSRISEKKSQREKAFSATPIGHIREKAFSATFTGWLILGLILVSILVMKAVEGKVKMRKFLSPTVAFIALISTGCSATATPRCSDVTSTVEDLSREKARKQIANTPDVVLFQRYALGSLQQSRTEPQRPSPPAYVPPPQTNCTTAGCPTRRATTGPGTGVAPPNICQPRDQPPLRNNRGMLVPGLQPCPEFDPNYAQKKAQEEQNKEQEVIAKIRKLYNDSFNGMQYTVSGARQDSIVGNKTLCSVNLHIIGKDIYGQDFSFDSVEEYSIQMTDDNRPWITLISETQVQ